MGILLRIRDSASWAKALTSSQMRFLRAGEDSHQFFKADILVG
jgi:hypothetical protein